VSDLDQHSTLTDEEVPGLPVATLDDPHFQAAVRDPRWVERVIALTLLGGIVAMGVFGAAYWQNWRPWILGLGLGVGLALLGMGLIAWGKYLMARGPFVEDRHDLSSTTAERDAMSAALVERTKASFGRRHLLAGLLAVGMGVFGIVLLFPVIRSLGPLPKKTLTRTNWRDGSLLVDAGGVPIHVNTLQPGGIVTVFPSGYETDPSTQSVDQTVLIRAQTTALVTEPGRETWAPAGYVAYSKVCTHAGCPVGLYERELRLLVCPCHQSMFNIDNGAVPQFGPAPRPLPQLPLWIDSQGFLRSQSGYDQPIGPGYWERS
jgi:ubiquinol-cytochrome c reductase iron-sulfur subunit